MIEAAWAADVSESRKRLHRAFKWFIDLDEPRQLALAAMHAEMGPADKADWDRVVGHTEKREFHQASAAMLISKWAARAGQRAWRIAQVMRTGDDAPKPEIRN